MTVFDQAGMYTRLGFNAYCNFAKFTKGGDRFTSRLFRFLGLGYGVDISAHHAHLIIFVGQILEQDVA